MKIATVYAWWMAMATAGLVVSGLAGTAAGQTVYEWDNTGGGDFGSALNWDPNTAVPGDGTDDWAVFHLDQDPAYIVTLDKARAFDVLQARTDQVILDLNGFDLDLVIEASGDFTNSQNNDDTTGTTALMVGRGMGTGDHDQSTLIIRNTGSGEATLTASSMTIGFTSGSTGTLIIEGENTVFSATSTTQNHMFVGIRGDGYLVVRDGASASLGRLPMTRRGGDSQVIIEGTGSTLTTGLVEISYRGSGDLIHVRDGGHLGSGTMRVAPWTGAATLIVENGTVSSGGIEMGRYRNVGTLQVIDGGVHTATTLRVGMGGQSGWDTRAGGIVEVSGADSRITTSGSATLGGSATTDRGTLGQMTVDNGGRVEIGDYLFMGSRGSVHLDNGALAVNGNLTVVDSDFGEDPNDSSTYIAAAPTYRLTLHDAAAGGPAPFTVDGAADLGWLGLDLGLVDGFAADVDEVFKALTITGTRMGTFLGLADDDTIVTDEGYEFRINYGADDISLTVTAIPEPGTLALLVAAAGILVLRRRPGSSGR